MSNLIIDPTEALVVDGDIVEPEDLEHMITVWWATCGKKGYPILDEVVSSDEHAVNTIMDIMLKCQKVGKSPSIVEACGQADGLAVQWRNTQI